jgi:hypothetical protein
MIARALNAFAANLSPAGNTIISERGVLQNSHDLDAISTLCEDAWDIGCNAVDSHHHARPSRVPKIKHRCAQQHAPVRDLSSPGFQHEGIQFS